MKKPLEWHRQWIDRDREALCVERNWLDIRERELERRELQLDKARQIGITEYDERTFNGVTDKRP